MINFIEINSELVNNNTILDINNIIGKYANYNTIIPQGSIFYKEFVTDYLPDYLTTDIKDKVLFNLKVDVNKTYGNSIMPNSYIDIYFKSKTDDNQILFEKLLSNVKVIGVKDKNGSDVFANSNNILKPEYIYFAVEKEIYNILKKSEYLENTELIPTPKSQSDNEQTTISSEQIMDYINSKTIFINEIEE